jgi:hypothetical protein
MKWILVEVDWNGKEQEMPIVYNTKEEAEEYRNIFCWENPNKGCIVREKED